MKKGKAYSEDSEARIRNNRVGAAIAFCAVGFADLAWAGYSHDPWYLLPALCLFLAAFMLVMVVREQDRWLR